jgi:hypothetical protein
MSTGSGVWEPDITRYGIMGGDLLVVRSSPGSPWECYDARRDPQEHSQATDPRCAVLESDGAKAFENGP